MVLTSILSNSIAGLHKNATQVHESAHKIVNIQSSSTVTNLFQSPASLQVQEVLIRRYLMQILVIWRVIS